MEKERTLKKYDSDLTDRVSKSLRDLLKLSEPNEDTEVEKSDICRMKQFLEEKFRKSPLVKAWNTRQISQDRKKRLQHLYENSRSQYTRERFQSLNSVEEVDDVPIKTPKQHKRCFSIPSIFASTRVNHSGKNTSQTSLLRTSAPSSLSSCPEETLSLDAEEAESCNGSHTDIVLESAGDLPQDNDGTKETVSELVKQWLEQNCDDPKINADRVPTRELLKYWMNLTDDTMRIFLKDLQRRSPSAYALQLLKHRLDVDVNGNQVVTEEENKGSTNVSIDEGYETCHRKSNLMSNGPWNKRVIVIAESPTVCIHPKRKYSTRTELNEKDKVILRRMTALNVSIYSKGSVIANINFVLQLLNVSEQLKINLRTIEFVYDNALNDQTIYVEIAVMKDQDSKHTSVISKSRLVSQDCKTLPIEEDLFLKNVNCSDFHISFLNFTLFSMKRNIKNTHRRVAEARFALGDLKTVTTDIQSTTFRC